MDIAFLSDTMLQLLRGAPLTLELAATSVGIGFVLALALALALQSGPAAVTWPIRGYVATFRGTPLLVQIFLIYYGLGQFRPTLQALDLWGFFRQPYWCAIFALTSTRPPMAQRSSAADCNPFRTARLKPRAPAACRPGRCTDSDSADRPPSGAAKLRQ